MINQDTPTSTLLSFKIGDAADFEKGISGIIEDILIQETDQYLAFIFTLTTGEEIQIKKMRQVC
ncbi:hypothetical protein [Pedobacter sp.]|uniref:hypothetical protein n=1 Tax=Pedobacter sp. TaxID=1411316 RepID=UPI003BA8A642